MSFISANQGWLLITPYSGGQGFVEHTTDGGRTWHKLGQVPLSAATGWHIKFADAEHGYVFGAGLAETNDGGRTWTNEHQDITALEPGAGNVVAVRSTGHALNSGHLVYAPVGSATFSTASTLAFSGQADSLTRQGNTVWALTRRASGPQSFTDRLLVSSNGGHSWTARALPPLSDGNGVIAIESAAPATVWMEYLNPLNATNPYLITSNDGGKRWNVQAHSGDALSVIQPTAANTGLLINVDSFGDPAVMRTRTGGAKWAHVLATPWPGPNRAVVFTTSDSRHVHLMIGNEVDTSVDGGATWPYAAVV